MAEALREAQKAALLGDVPVGAVLVCGEHIIARAHNEKEAKQDPTEHAEMMVIREACQKRGDWHLADCTLYVTLEPCPMCAGAMVSAHLGNLVFGASDSAYGACGSLFYVAGHPAFPHRMQVIGGIMQEECEKLLKDFFANKRREKENKREF